MTSLSGGDQRFAWIAQHGGPVVDWADSSSSYRHRVRGEGLSDWSASDNDNQDRPLGLSKHIGEANGTRMLELRVDSLAASGGKPVYWSSSLKVGEGRYVRASNSSADFPSALNDVEAHVHESRQLAGLTWWRESEDRWVTWLGAFDLSATRITSPSRGAYWHFEVRGDAPTLEEAALLAVLGRLDASGAGDGRHLEA